MLWRSIRVMQEMWSGWSATGRWVAATLAFAIGFWLWWILADVFWKWFFAKYDSAVLRVFTDEFKYAQLQFPDRVVTPMALSVTELAEEIKRSRSSVYKSLRRLEERGKVREVKTGKWLLWSEGSENRPGGPWQGSVN